MFTATSLRGRVTSAISGSWVPSPLPTSAITPPAGSADASVRTLINPTPPMPTYSKLRRQDPRQFNQLVDFLSSLK